MRGMWRAKRLFRRAMPQAVILLYHRVADETLDPQWLCVSPKHFDEHLQVLRKCCRPMSLKGLVSRYRYGMVPDRAAVVTFDDGYADNLLQAAPILSRNDARATVFVASGMVGRLEEFWWDELDRILLTAHSLPAELNITISGVLYKWHLGDAANYDLVTAGGYSGWSVLRPETPTIRHEIYRFMCKIVKELTWDQKRLVLSALQQWAGMGATGRQARRALSPDEVVSLDRSGVVEIGAHTVSHAMLSASPVDGQKTEIMQGKQMLEGMLGRKIELFAYPYGDRADYTHETMGLVREAGFNCACSNFEGHIYPWTDRYQLPRFLVRNWDGDEFERRLEQFLTE